MKNNNSSFKYNEFRARNAKNSKNPMSNDLKEIDQLSKKLDTFTFHKKNMNKSFKKIEAPNFQGISP